jgi:molecular chaperone GrpE
MAETNTGEAMNQEEILEQDSVETDAVEETVEEAAEDCTDSASEAAGESGDKKKGFFQKKKDKKDEQIEELNDRLKRNMAEFDNFRKDCHVRGGSEECD